MLCQTLFFQYFIPKMWFLSSNLGPNLTSKTYHFLSCSHQDPNKPDGNPKNPPKPALDASRTLRKPREWASGHRKSAFFLPHTYCKHKRNNRKHGLLPTTQMSSKLRPSLSIQNTFGPILGNSPFGQKIWTLTTHPESAKFVSKSTDCEPDASRSLQSTQSEAPKKRTETAAIPMEPSERVLCTNKGDRSYARI